MTFTDLIMMRYEEMENMASKLECNDIDREISDILTFTKEEIRAFFDMCGYDKPMKGV